MFAKNYSGTGNRWLSGKVVRVTGPVSAVIELSDGTKVRKHFDQIRKVATETQSAEDELCDDISEPTAEFELESAIDSSGSDSESELPAEVMVTLPRRSYPSRHRRPPECLEPTY